MSAKLKVAVNFSKRSERDVSDALTGARLMEDFIEVGDLVWLEDFKKTVRVVRKTKRTMNLQYVYSKEIISVKFRFCNFSILQLKPMV